MLHTGNRGSDRHLYVCGQGAAVPRQEGATQVTDAETGASTSTGQTGSCFARGAVARAGRRREQVNSNPITGKREMSMSANPKRQLSTEPQPASIHPGTGGVSAENPTREEKIRRRAYEIYLEGGEQPGREMEDWLQAERELERGVLWLAQAN
jgi:hypothetical protein